ncbi:FAD:protein FMN transferase [Shewanella sp. NIFS-20-20]|uniref:FAD:protein FMN transferase n=1 Tax=Shewanella sp. NIFS-20-20 TaxID=2853806 RepID=UPI001C4634C9|nr:FAD:protein FMN transferase [Shewanella sp. NIFS-20-20]MBV7317081.1 FAD:protein FMN transferase [Shewanella sp. NIFS-20-20]
MLKTLCYWPALVGLAFFVSGCSPTSELVKLSGQTMGTTYHISVVSNDRLPEAAVLQQQIDVALELVNDQMSTYRPDSELSQFNQAGSNQRVNVSADTIKVIEAGMDLHRKTDGALDITLGPLVNMWGFGPDKRPITEPSQAQIDAAMTRTGIDKIVIDGLTLSKTSEDLYVDLSSIAKGFGVDTVASILAAYQVPGYLVEIGGEIAAYGHKADGSAWRIAIEQPSENGRQVQQVIEPGNMAMATSGDYRNYYEFEGERFSHLIDPRTGYPIKHALASVTVLAPECMTADGLATAMMVLGTEASLALAKQMNLAIMLIEKQPQGFVVHYSDAFQPYLSKQ